MDIQKVLFDEIFEAEGLTKSQATKLRIINGTIQCYIRHGANQTTYQKIAKLSKCSFALTKHYFPDPDELFEMVAKYIRVNFQRVAVEAIRSKHTPTDQLVAYIKSTFDWVDDYRDHGRVWMLFFFNCSIKKGQRATNTDLVNMGHARITALLNLGRSQKLFSFRSAEETARLIQIVISGALVAMLTEDIGQSQKEALLGSVTRHCMSLVT